MLPIDDFRVVWDVLDGGPGPIAVVLIVALLGGLGTLIYFVHKIRTGRRQGDNVLVWYMLVVGLLAVLTLGGVSLWNVYSEYHRCVDLAKNGQFRIVEGDVKDFRAHGNRESFTVGGERFNVTSHPLGSACYRELAADGGPITAGKHVRISHNEGRILKVEVRD
jgi:hypothetical protein